MTPYQAFIQAFDYLDDFFHHPWYPFCCWLSEEWESCGLPVEYNNEPIYYGPNEYYGDK